MRILIISLLLIIFSCKELNKENNETTRITTSEFDLMKSEKQNGLLILFPCFPCNAKNTLSEFKILESSKKYGFSVLAMNLNEHLFLKQSEKKQLAERLEKIILENNISKERIFIGGFSSGGNVSLLISNYLAEIKSQIQPKGVFVVDSPIDLLGLYRTAEKNITSHFSKTSIQEATWIKSFLEKEFGNPKNGIDKYEMNSPFTLETQNIKNLKNLKSLKIRFYTEPDLKWWKENRKNDYEDLNAFYLKKLSDKLSAEFGNDKIELIETKNRGYRANGERHPHSWSIVNQDDLLKWMSE
ncbi:hypothetical protein ACOSP6_06825 [Tenacibaculum sp. MEBiC06402]|uniref:hypothetical protein n=1 Tax=unclassified Tenacibaculum TaxID=2635139 RepID=UPI003B9C21AE